MTQFPDPDTIAALDTKGEPEMKARILSVGAMALLAVFATSTFARVQWDERHWRRYNKKQVEEIIKSVEDSTDRFRKDFDRWLDHSHFDGKEKEDKFNSKVKKFEESTDRLRHEYDRRDSWWETRNEVQKVLNEGDGISRMMRSHQFGRDVEDQWRRLRSDMNKLASTYQLRFVGDEDRGRRGPR